MNQFTPSVSTPFKAYEEPEDDLVNVTEGDTSYQVFTNAHPHMTLGLQSTTYHDDGNASSSSNSSTPHTPFMDSSSPEIGPSSSEIFMRLTVRDNLLAPPKRTYGPPSIPFGGQASPLSSDNDLPGWSSHVSQSLAYRGSSPGSDISSQHSPAFSVSDLDSNDMVFGTFPRMSYSQESLPDNILFDTLSLSRRQPEPTFVEHAVPSMAPGAIDFADYNISIFLPEDQVDQSSTSKLPATQNWAGSGGAFCGDSMDIHSYVKIEHQDHSLPYSPGSVAPGSLNGGTIPSMSSTVPFYRLEASYLSSRRYENFGPTPWSDGTEPLTGPNDMALHSSLNPAASTSITQIAYTGSRNQDPLLKQKSDIRKHLLRSKTLEEAKDAIVQVATASRDESYMTVFNSALTNPLEISEPGQKAAMKRRKDKRKRLFKCLLCRNSLTTKDNLKNHYRSHLKLDEFQCDRCQSTFRTAATLKRHKAHTQRCKAPS